MKTTPENPSAFPAEGGSDSGLYATPGMTLRDYFAAKAMRAVMDANYSRYAEPICADHCAIYAYRYADAMLAARQQPAPGEG